MTCRTVFRIITKPSVESEIDFLGHANDVKFVGPGPFNILENIHVSGWVTMRPYESISSLGSPHPCHLKDLEKRKRINKSWKFDLEYDC